MTKNVTVQAKVNGKVIFDKTLGGLKNKHSLIIQAMELVDSSTDPATIRVQTVGAKGWALYGYIPQSNTAILDLSLVW